MIETPTVRMSVRGVLPALFLVAILSGTALAGGGDPAPGEPLGADSVGQRVRERERMQAEYEVMREERRLALAGARKSVAAALSGEDESVRNPAVIRTLAGVCAGSARSAASERVSGGASASGGSGSGFRTFMICAVLVMLCTVLYLSFRNHREDLK